jgi:DNA-binding transcriptional LysR family regulator
MVAPLVAGFDSVKPAFASIQDTLPQTLVVATAPTFIVYELHPPIAQMNTLFPKLHLVLLERNSPIAIEVLEQGGADVAIVAKPESVPMNRTLDYTLLTHYPFTLMCPPGHPLLKKKRVTLEDFTRYPLILPGKPAYCRHRFDAVLGAAGLAGKVRIVIESNFPVLYFDYVRIGMGVALTPLPTEDRLRERLKQPGVVLRNVEHLFGGEPIYYVRRKGQFETPCATRFRELMISQHATSEGLLAAPNKTKENRAH